MTELNHTIGMALNWAEHALIEAKASTTPMLDAEVLLMHAANLTKEEVFFDISRELDETIYHNYERLIARRKNGEPVAYIIGKKEFFNLEFEVDNCVLIPRPETEELVEKALEFIKDYNGKKLTVLDLGTGSGAIAVSIAVSIKKWVEKYNFDIKKIKLIASDISAKALEKAKKNAKKCQVAKMIEFVESDLLKDIKNVKDIDLIVANLPYLDPGKRSGYSPELSEEPYIALYAGKNGMDYYDRLFKELKKTKNNPKVIVECFEYQKEALQKLYDNLEFIVVDDVF